MKKLLVFILVLTSFATLSQSASDCTFSLNTPYNNNDKNQRTQRFVGMDVNSKGDVIISALTKKDGAIFPEFYRVYHEDKHGMLTTKNMNEFYNFSAKNVINEVKVLHDDWVTVCGYQFVAFLNQSITPKVVLDPADNEAFRNANFMEITETPDGRIAILYAISNQGNDQLGLLLCDFKADAYYFSTFYEGEIDKMDDTYNSNVLSDRFEMEAISNKHVIIGSQSERGKDYLNEFMVVDLDEIVAADQGKTDQALVKKGRFSSYSSHWFKDMVWDSTSNMLYVLLEGEISYDDALIFVSAKVDPNNIKNISFTSDNRVQIKLKDLASNTKNIHALSLMKFGDKKYLNVSGSSDSGPNINLFYPESYKQPERGSGLIHYMKEKNEGHVEWVTKELTPISIPYIGTDGAFKQFVAALVHKDNELYRTTKPVRLIISDLTYAKLSD